MSSFQLIIKTKKEYQVLYPSFGYQVILDVTHCFCLVNNNGLLLIYSDLISPKYLAGAPETISTNERNNETPDN